PSPRGWRRRSAASGKRRPLWPGITPSSSTRGRPCGGPWTARRATRNGRRGKAGVESMKKAEVGVFGGSGFYQFLDDVEEVWVETPYGQPSDRVALATIGDVRVAFLPRHGKDHRYPPHKINYRANVWAMKELGVHSIIGPCAAGSLKKEIRPGDFVVSDQFVHRTWGRADTFFE